MFNFSKESVIELIFNVINTLDDPFYILDKDLNIKFMNKKTFASTNLDRDNVGRNFFEVFPAAAGTELESNFKKVLSTNEPLSFVHEGIYQKSTFMITIYPFSEGLTVSVKNIDKLMKVQNDLEIALKEKEFLLKEIHHRLKNNLQIISSIINLQKNFLESDKEINILNDTQHRIQAISAIHNKLYLSTDFINISLNSYILDISRDVFHSLEHKSQIRLDYDMDEVEINSSSAVSIGLIITELITNAIKYAFDTSKPGEILISLKKIENCVLLSVKDNGKGMPADFDLKKSDSLGMQIVFNLIEQLDSKIDVRVNNGTEFLMEFPIEKLQ